MQTQHRQPLHEMIIAIPPHFHCAVDVCALVAVGHLI